MSAAPLGSAGGARRVEDHGRVAGRPRLDAVEGGGVPHRSASPPDPSDQDDDAERPGRRPRPARAVAPGHDERGSPSPGGGGGPRPPRQAGSSGPRRPEPEDPVVQGRELRHVRQHETTRSPARSPLGRGSRRPGGSSGRARRSWSPRRRGPAPPKRPRARAVRSRFSARFTQGLRSSAIVGYDGPTVVDHPTVGHSDGTHIGGECLFASHKGRSRVAVDVARIDPRIVRPANSCWTQVDDIACASARIIREEEPHYVDIMSFEELVAAVSPNIIGLVESVMVNETSLLAAPRRTGREARAGARAADDGAARLPAHGAAHLGAAARTVRRGPRLRAGPSSTRRRRCGARSTSTARSSPPPTGTWRRSSCCVTRACGRRPSRRCSAG